MLRILCKLGIRPRPPIAVAVKPADDGAERPDEQRVLEYVAAVARHRADTTRRRRPPRAGAARAGSWVWAACWSYRPGVMRRQRSLPGQNHVRMTVNGVNRRVHEWRGEDGAIATTTACPRPEVLFRDELGAAPRTSVRHRGG